MKGLRCILFVSIVVGITLLMDICATFGLQEGTKSVQPVKTLSYPYHDHVSPIAFSLDGRFLAGCSGKEIILWEISTGNIVSKFNFVSFSSLAEGCSSVTFSPDGKFLAVAGEVGSIKLAYGIKIYEIPTGKLINSWEVKFVIPPYGISYTTDGKFLVIGNAWEKTLSLWEESTGKLIYTVTHGGGRIPMGICISVSPDGKYFASGYGNYIKLWEVSSGNLISTLTSSERVFFLKFTPDGKYLISGHKNGVVNIWELSEGKGKLITPASVVEGSPRSVFSIVDVYNIFVTPDSKNIITFIVGTLYYTYLAILEFPTGKIINTFSLGKSDQIALSPDGKYLAITARGNIRLYDVNELIKVPIQAK